MSVLSYVAEACRLYVLVTLLFAAWGKTNAIDEFTHSLVGSFAIPQAWARRAAFGIVALEWSIAALLLVRGAVAWAGMLAAFVLLSIFSAAIGAALWQKKMISCNCFGRSGHTVSVYDVYRNLLLVLACAIHLLYAEARPMDVLAHALLTAVGFMAFLISANLLDIALTVRARTAGTR